MDDVDAAARSVMVGIALFVLFVGVDVAAEGKVRRARSGGMMAPKCDGACQKPSWSCWKDF